MTGAASETSVEHVPREQVLLCEMADKLEDQDSRARVREARLVAVWKEDFGQMADMLDEHARRAADHGRELNQHGRRLDQIEAHLEEHGRQLNRFEGRMEQVGRRLSQVEAELVGHTHRFDQIDERSERSERFERFERAEARLGRVETLLLEVLRRLPEPSAPSGSSSN